MTNNWSEHKWGELATLEYGKGIRDYAVSRGEYPVYGANGQIGWYGEALCLHPGIIIGRKGAYRGVHYSSTPFHVIDIAFYLEPKTDFDPRWAYYQLLTQDINGMDSGSAIPSTSRDAFYQLPLLLPTLTEQRAIAAILGALDDKINLNRRMNQTLEAMAQALFKSWFVDLEPLGARTNGLPIPSIEEITTLADDRVLDTAQDSLANPSVSSVSLSHIIEINPVRTLPAGTVAPYLEMSNAPTSSARILRSELRSFSSGTRFKNGDVLVARITPCLENGKTAYVDFLDEGQTGWGSTEFIVLRSKPPLPTEYAYFLARTEGFRTHAIRNMSGTSGRQRVPPESLRAYVVAEPSPELARKFGDFSRTTFSSMKSNDKQVSDLAAIRDFLLPKLLSGEIRIPEAVMAVEAVA